MTADGMTKRRFIPGERHHWWPKSVSQYWADGAGRIGRIDPLGNVVRSTPTRTARISDGHNLRSGSPWDTTFEHLFDGPDGSFPRVVELLEDLTSTPSESRDFIRHEISEQDLQVLCECLVSLSVRSPRFRDQVRAFVDQLRSDVRKEEYKQLAAVNMQQTYFWLMRSMNGLGKFLVLRSDNQEFIFGDGFYNNITLGSQNLFNTRILLPLTPWLAVLYASPMEYMVEPRLVSLRTTDEMVSIINETMQIYAKHCLFFRYDQPDLSDYFLCREHLQYAEGDPIAALIERIPGVRTQNRILSG